MSVIVLRMYRGDDRAWPMTLTADGDPLDLTDAEDVRFTAVSNVEGDAVISLDLTSGVSVTGAPTGEILVSLAPVDTSALEIASDTYRYWLSRPRFRRLYWDIEVTNSAGHHRTWPEDPSGRPRLGHLLVFADVSV